MPKKTRNKASAGKDLDPRREDGQGAAGGPGRAAEDGGFLQRWSKRKVATAELGGTGADSKAAATEAAPALPEAGGSEEDALSDEELCEKYELRHPERCDDPAELGEFFKRPLPDRLRQMAMRRMWRINPLFRFADEMVEYGENYTDAATVLPDMKTAYQVGKGYFDKLAAEAAPSEDGEDAGKAGEDTGGPDADEAEDAGEEQEQAKATDSDRPEGSDGAGRVAGGESSGGLPSAETTEADARDAPEENPRPVRPRQVSFRRPGPP